MGTLANSEAPDEMLHNTIRRYLYLKNENLKECQGFGLQVFEILAQLPYTRASP